LSPTGRRWDALAQKADRHHRLVGRLGRKKAFFRCCQQLGFFGLAEHLFRKFAGSAL
jgi:hypothetical protein